MQTYEMWLRHERRFNEGMVPHRTVCLGFLWTVSLSGVVRLRQSCRPQDVGGIVSTHCWPIEERSGTLCVTFVEFLALGAAVV